MANSTAYLENIAPRPAYLKCIAGPSHYLDETHFWVEVLQNGNVADDYTNWVVWGGGITNHEAFAFTLQSAEPNVGAFISDITVFTNNSEAPGQTSYFINLQAMEFNSNNFNITPVNLGITGNFESNGV